MTTPQNFICPITQDTMTDPVICSDGISYERSAIERWLFDHDTSPMTNKPLTSKTLISNITLRNTINDFKNTNTIKPSTITVAGKKNYEIDIMNTTFQFNNKYYANVSIRSVNVQNNAKCIVCIVDTSGSMNELASIPNSTESSNFTRLDLVKHTLNTIVESLNFGDMFGIITFSDNAYINQELTVVNSHTKQIILDNIKILRAGGMTNLWEGLRFGMNMLNTVNSADYTSSMMVLTDGASNVNPPRGVTETLQNTVSTNKQKYTINTFGYSYNVDSVLLEQISRIGSGVYGFIPDSTMVGTVFINMLSNISISTTSYAEVDFLSNKYETKILSNKNIGMISSNPTHVLLESEHPISGEFILNYDGNVIKNVINSSSVQNFNDDDVCQVQRIKLVNILKESLQTKTQELLLNFKDELKGFQNNTFIQNLMIDIYDNDDSRGQLGKSLQKPEWFQKWGFHYLKSIIRAHELEKCMNFKDKSIQYYTTQDFNVEQKRIEDIFCNLTPPEPSGYSYGASSGPIPTNMNAYYNQHGGCFDGNGLVKMADGSYKRVQDIVKGDTVYSSLSSNKTAVIKCVLKLKIFGKIPMNSINDMYITEYHPIMYKNKWTFPVNVNKSILVTSNVIDYMYDFVLDEGHTVDINKVTVLTLGHGYTFNDVVSHDYFGDKIIQDLIEHPGWVNGTILLNDYKFVRNDNMTVNKLLFL